MSHGRSAVVACAAVVAAACRGPLTEHPVEPGLATATAAAPGGASAPARVGPPVVLGAYAVYVSNEQSGDVSAIDPARPAVVATLPLGKRPRGVRASPDGTRLFVALSGSPPAPPGVDPSSLPPPDRGADGIGVVRLPAFALETVLRGPSDPEQLSVSRDGRHLYVANEDNGRATVIDVTTGDTVASAEVGIEPEGVTTSPDGRWVYVTSENDGHVAVIDTATNQVVARVPVGGRPRDSAFAPDGRTAYVTAENDGTVSIVDGRRHRVRHTITLEGDLVRPMGVVVSPDGARVYVTTGRGGTVVAIDAASRQVAGVVAVGERPWGVGISPDGSRLYTANGPSNDVSIVDTTTLTEVARVAVGRSPWGIAVVPLDTPPVRAR